MSAGPVALTLGGGAARAAYQVGFLRHLAHTWPRLRIPIVTGVSAGAINATYLAHFEGELPLAVDSLHSLWSRLTTEQVFRTDLASLGRLALQWTARLALGGARVAPRPRGLVDTSPLREFLAAAFQTRDGRLGGIAENLAKGRMVATAVTTTDYASGRTTTWFQGGGVGGWERSNRRGVPADLTLDHVMASCAIPIFFPAVRLEGTWHGDGGIRQIAPLSPALKLGAERVLAISTRYPLTAGESGQGDGYPPPAQVVGLLFNAVFLDMLDYDAVILRRINALVEGLPEEKRLGLRPCRVLLMRPSRDPGRIAAGHERKLPRPFRFLVRGLGTRETTALDLLSMLMFEPEYLRDLMALGEADAQARTAEIEDFLGAPVEARG